MRSHTDGSAPTEHVREIHVSMQRTKRKYSELDTVLEGPDQLDSPGRPLLRTWPKTIVLFPCCARRFHYVFPLPVRLTICYDSMGWNTSFVSV